MFTGITFLMILLRCKLFYFESRDYDIFLSKWFYELKAAGGLKGLSLSLGDYTPPYLYILAILTYLPIKALYSIKAVSCIFDFLLAFSIAKNVYSINKNINNAIFCYTVFLITPTVFLNSAFWAQCDVIFSYFIVISIISFMKEKPVKGIIFFTVSFCFKLQAVYFIPVILFLWIKNKVKIKHLLIAPLVFIISIIPAFIAGRDFKELLLIYFNQTKQYKEMSLNAPNLYWLIKDVQSSGIAGAAILICFTSILCVIYYLFIKKFKVTSEFILLISLFFSILIPFLLPHMHERYFYLADVLSVFYVFYNKKRFYIPILVVLSSLICYLPYLFSANENLIYIAIIAMLLSMLAVLFNIFDYIKANSLYSLTE